MMKIAQAANEEQSCVITVNEGSEDVPDEASWRRVQDDEAMLEDPLERRTASPHPLQDQFASSALQENTTYSGES